MKDELRTTIGKFLKEIDIEVAEAGLVQILHVLTKDVGLDLSERRP